jgi:hypothetical protein
MPAGKEYTEESILVNKEYVNIEYYTRGAGAY